jgi:hypothetical protein
MSFFYFFACAACGLAPRGDCDRIQQIQVLHFDLWAHHRQKKNVKQWARVYEFSCFIQKKGVVVCVIRDKYLVAPPDRVGALSQQVLARGIRQAPGAQHQAPPQRRGCSGWRCSGRQSCRCDCGRCCGHSCCCWCCWLGFR